MDDAFDNKHQQLPDTQNFMMALNAAAAMPLMDKPRMPTQEATTQLEQQEEMRQEQRSQNMLTLITQKLLGDRTPADPNSDSNN